jgi:hypothetical protein
MAMVATEALAESRAGPPWVGIGTYATNWCLLVCALNPQWYAALLVVVVVVVVVEAAAAAARKVMMMMMKEQQQVAGPEPGLRLGPWRCLLALPDPRHVHELQLRLHRKRIRHPRPRHHHFRHHRLGEERAVLRQQTTTDHLSIKMPRGDILKGVRPSR